MTFERFIELLQQLITMTDPKNEEQVLNAKNILKNLMELAHSSEMADAVTIRAMHQGYSEFAMLLRSKESFAGKRGDFSGNQAKRNRLAMMLRPHC